jgi:hypothetical protein
MGEPDRIKIPEVGRSDYVGAETKNKKLVMTPELQRGVRKLVLTSLQRGLPSPKFKILRENRLISLEM